MYHNPKEHNVPRGKEPKLAFFILQKRIAFNVLTCMQVKMLKNT